MTTGSTARRGPYRKGIQRRERIIDTAVEVFAERGYGSGSMREIAARAGLTQAGLLHHFTSKEELLVEVLRRRDASVAAAIARAPATVRERMRALVAHNLAENGLTSLFTVLSAEATAPDHPAHDWFSRRYREQHDRGTALFAAERDAGRVRADVAPEVVSALVTSVLDGLQLQQRHRPGTDPFAVLDAVFRLLDPDA